LPEKTTTMTKLDDILQSVIADMDGVFGYAVIDMNSRQLLGVAHKVDFLTPSYLEALAAAAAEMLRGKPVRAVESLLSAKLGKTISNSINDICINAGDTRHFMAVIPEKPDLLLVLSTDKNTSVAMGWITIQRNMGLITEHCA
jgi:hypothetical protein